jgi:RNA recognition motif-containing protein
VDRHNLHGSGERALGLVIDKSSRVHLSNIPVAVLERDGSDALRSLFEDYGPIERYVLFTDNTGRLTGSGMCTYSNPADAKMAIYRLHEREMEDGSLLSVVMAKEHGVVTADTVRRQMREEKQGGSADEGRWGHDLYDSIESGGRVKGLPGWAVSRYKEATRTEVRRNGSSRVDAQFEEYVRQRDEQRNENPQEKSEAQQEPQTTAEEPNQPDAMVELP